MFLGLLSAFWWMRLVTGLEQAHWWEELVILGLVPAYYWVEMGSGVSGLDLVPVHWCVGLWCWPLWWPGRCSGVSLGSGFLKTNDLLVCGWGSVCTQLVACLSTDADRVLGEAGCQC